MSIEEKTKNLQAAIDEFRIIDEELKSISTKRMNAIEKVEKAQIEFDEEVDKMRTENKIGAWSRSDATYRKQDG